MRPLSNETFVVFDDKLGFLVANMRILICIDSQTPGSRVIIFASQAGLKRLAFSLNWYGDGTFRVVPRYLFGCKFMTSLKFSHRFEWQKVFHQLYTLSGEILDKVFGSAYCLLEKKDKNIYCKIFSFILHWAEQHGHSLTIKNEGGRLKTDLGESY